MNTGAVMTASRIRPEGSRHDTEILSRLSKVKGQLAGIASMCQGGRCRIDILDQLAAARAAMDAVGLILLEDHINACLRAEIDRSNGDEIVPELLAAVRRFVRSR